MFALNLRYSEMLLIYVNTRLAKELASVLWTKSPPTKEEVHVFARVCLFVCLSSVCLLARLLKNAYMDLDDMLRIN